MGPGPSQRGPPLPLRGPPPGNGRGGSPRGGGGAPSRIAVAKVPARGGSVAATAPKVSLQQGGLSTPSCMHRLKTVTLGRGELQRLSADADSDAFYYVDPQVGEIWERGSGATEACEEWAGERRHACRQACAAVPSA